MLSRSDIRDKTIEQRSEVKVSLLPEVTESIPEESLETLRQIKESEGRSRLREEEGETAERETERKDEEVHAKILG